jgi:prevent-host-death family protein
VPTSPQRELRNQVGDVLRRAEQGERFTITVGGRPVAELGPRATGSVPAPADRLSAILADAPVDARWREDLRRARGEERSAATDPWHDGAG